MVLVLSIKSTAFKGCHSLPCGCALAFVASKYAKDDAELADHYHATSVNFDYHWATRQLSRQVCQQ